MEEKVATSSGCDYEVFLSFRGPDTRAGFTDFLYTSLKGAGIRTFKDDEDLRKGVEFAPELLRAIKQSKIFIPIFSKDYASSIWCLKEVVQMVECKKNGGKKIMPIFYDVAPSEVRYQIGNYEKSFLLHERKESYDQKTIGEWKDALRAVGEINGWELPRGPTRREGEFARKLTRKVFNELKQAYLVVSDCLVSVDNHVDAIMEKISAQTSETRIIGIHGMGGIGKTTIAKIIYNRLSNNFEDCCFLSNIREMSERKGIECLQNQLISDILKDKCIDIRNIDDGIKTIKDRLSNKRVLLLLDDVHEKNHIDALVGGRDWFGRGSKLLITTRNKEVLDVFEVDNHYELTGMDRSQSLQLFSKHAFRRDSPLDEYIDQSNRVIDIAKGLPLALEVIGSLLSRTEKRKWNDILEKLENVPHTEVQRKLKISYDALEVRHKHIFLDIACLFIGCDKDVMVHFWEKSKFFPKEALIVLQNMSLIKIEENNSVWMHDQLRDLGREIVRQESNTKIQEQSRVWDPKEGLVLLRKHKGEKKVEALRLKLDNHQRYCFSYEGFENLSHLKFLEVDGSIENFCVEERLLWPELPSIFFPTNENSYLLPQLRWLSWHDISPFNIANFSMEDVVIFNLSGSKITDDWKGWSHMKVMMNLKVLDMSNCSLLERLPDSIGSLESLIELDISKTSIKELPDSIGNLKKLKVVKMRESRLSKIPDVLWSMGNLEHIMASSGVYGFRERHFHVQIGNGICGSQSLRILILESADIYPLPRLPESLINLQMSILHMGTFPDLSNLTNLEKMDLEFGWPHHDVISNGLGEHPMPRWLGNLSKLEFLALCSHHGTTSPTNLALPPQLKSLRLECPNLRHLPRLPSSLSYLKLDGCKSLCSMEDLSNLKKLSSLRILSAAIAEIQGLGCLENLRDLYLHSLRQVKILPDLSNLNKLTSLRVEYCDKLVEIQGQLPRFLDFFHVDDCGSLQKLPDLSSLMGKQALFLYNCKKINVEAILDVARLNPRHFKFVDFEQLQILPDLSNSNELIRLQVQQCDNLVEIQGELPQSLEVLEIDSCKSLWKLPNLSSLTGLREVSIGYCDNLVEIPGELPQSLKKLRIFYCGSLQKLPCLSSLIRLRAVRIQNCDNLVEIQGELPQFLEVLEIHSCKSLQKLPNLSSSMGLREVRICFCNDLVEIQGELPQSLEKLVISSCVSLRKLPYLSSLIGLQEVCVLNCGNLVEILSELPQSLEKLEIYSCRSLQKLPNLLSSMGLQEVHIRYCNDLVEIPSELPQSLEKLVISSCESLQKLPNLSSLIRLREFSIHNCDQLVEIPGELPQSLEVLDIYECQFLQELPNLSSLKGLQKVKIIRCRKLNVKAISSLCLEMSVKSVEVDDEYDSEADVEVDDEYDSKEDE
ncbi:hypothetical protein ACJRO7_032355 [Eucalyptus globulus]|uniref:TIR domain-containing protein n=1 Tax=Eucalyptus globulus TaxID=34317 RepID=A0ABD3JLU4_EUCGL